MFEAHTPRPRAKALLATNQRVPWGREFGRFEDVLSKLEEWESAGLSVYVRVNSTGGSRAKQIEKIRALSIEFDAAGEDHVKSQTLPESWHVEPTMVVRRGASVHWHWLVTRCPVADFERYQKRLVNRYSADGNAVGRERLWRLPGFKHPGHPDEEVELVLGDGAELVELNGPMELAQLVADLPELPPEQPRVPSQAIGEPISLALLTLMLSYIDPTFAGDDEGKVWVGIAKAIWYAELPVIEQDVDWPELCIAWSSGELWRQRTGDKDFEVMTYHDEVTLELRIKDGPSRDGKKIGIGSIYEYAKSGGFTGTPHESLINRFDAQTPPQAPLSGSAVGGSGSEKDGLDKLSLESMAKIDMAIAEINERFAMVTGPQNRGLVADLTDPSRVVFLPWDKFERPFANRKLALTNQENEKLKKQPNIAKIWGEALNRRDITEFVFEPTGSRNKIPKGAHNLWQGFAIESKEGTAHQPLLDHLLDMVCGGDEVQYKWLEAWLADLVQHPGDRQFGTAIAMRGTQGSGKSVLYRYLERIFGRNRHALQIANREQLVGRFNAHFANTVLLSVEEIALTGSNEAMAKLKTMITEPTIAVEPKFASIFTISNHTRLMLTANQEWFVNTEPGDRRWAVFDVKADHANDRAYFEPIGEAVEKGDGAANLLHHLLHLEYDRERILFRPPESAAKAAQTAQSLEPVDGWWRDVLADHRLGMPDNYVPPSPVTDGVFEATTLKGLLWDDYVLWCREHQKTVGDVSQFWKRIWKLTDESMKEMQPRSTGMKRVVWLPSRQFCQEAFARVLNGKWEDVK